MNKKYDISQFDIWQRLDFSPSDFMEIRERSVDPSDADIKFIRKWSEKYPEDETILIYLADALAFDSQFIEAKEILKKIFELYPKKKSHDAINADLHIKINDDWDLERAASLADEGLAIYPSSFDFVIVKAEILK